MKNIELVIKIPEDTYKDIVKNGFIYDEDNEVVTHAVKNGAPLPKGHERLIILSEDAVKREQTLLSFSCQNWISEVGLSNATVAIIEADKESEDVE